MTAEHEFSFIDKLHLIFISSLFVLHPLVVVSIRFETNMAESLFNILVLIGFLISGLVCFQHRSIYFPFKTTGILIGLFGLFCFAHFYLGPWYFSGFNYFLQFWMLSIFCFSVLQALRHPNAKLILMVLFFMQGLYQTYVGLYQRLISLPTLKSEVLANSELLSTYNIGTQLPMMMDRVEGMLPYGSLIYPNAFAMFLVLHLVNVFCLFGLLKSFFQKHLILLSVFMIVSIVPVFLNLWFAEAKGVWLAMVVSLGIVLYVYIWKKLKAFGGRAFWAVSSLILMLGCFIVYQKAPAVLSFKVRIDYWHAGWNMISETTQYLFGLGVGGFSERYSQYKIASGWEVQKPHNYFIFILVSYGFVGLFLFVLPVFLFIKDFLTFNNKDETFSSSTTLTLDEGFAPKIYHFFGLLAFFIIYGVPLIIGSGLDSPLAIVQLICFMLIVIGRMIVNQKLFILLKFEEYLLWQLILFTSFFFIFYIYIMPLFFHFGDWISTDDLNQTVIILLCAVLLFSLLFALLKSVKVAEFKIQINSSLGLSVGLFVFSFFILMILGDMVFHFPSVMIAVFVLLICCWQFNRGVIEKDFIILSNSKIGLSVLGGFCLFVFLTYNCFIKKDLSNANAFSQYQLFAYHLSELERLNNNDPEFKEKSKRYKIAELKQLLIKVPKNYLLRKDLVNAQKDLASFYDGVNEKIKAELELRDSLSNLEKLILLKPYFASSYSEKAELLLLLNEKVEHLEKAHEVACFYYPFKAIYHFELGYFYQNLNKLKLAKKSYDMAFYCHGLSDRRGKLNIVEYRNLKKNYLEIQQLSD